MPTALPLKKSANPVGALELSVTSRLIDSNGQERFVDDDWTEWVKQSQRQDRAAFARLIRKFERTAIAVAYGCLGDATGAVDVVQESFFKAWQKLGELKDVAQFPAWLCTLTRNIAIDHRRKIKPISGPLTSQPIEDTREWMRPGHEMECTERQAQITAAMDELDDISRSAIVLKYYQSLPSEKIGELLGITAAAVDMRLSRARQALKERLSVVMVQE